MEGLAPCPALTCTPAKLGPAWIWLGRHRPTALLISHQPCGLVEKQAIQAC